MTGQGSGGMMGMMARAGPNILVLLNYLQIKISLSQSATTAENAVGNNSHATAAHFGVENGYLVYTVFFLYLAEIFFLYGSISNKSNIQKI